MERRIIIKHHGHDELVKARKVIQYLKLFVDSNEKIICFFNVVDLSIQFVEEFETFEKNDKIEVVKAERKKGQRKYVEYEILIDWENIEWFLNFVERYELNVMILQNDVRVFLNDNDGDFIVINSHHEKYSRVKNFK